MGFNLIFFLVTHHLPPLQLPHYLSHIYLLLPINFFGRQKCCWLKVTKDSLPIVAGIIRLTLPFPMQTENPLATWSAVTATTVSLHALKPVTFSRKLMANLLI